MDIVRYSTTEEFIRSAVQWLTGAILQAQHDGKTVTVGLAGGSTPKPVYTMLATEKSIDWSRVQFFLLDERYVPADHADSNLKMIKESLLTREAAGADIVHPNTMLPLEQCIADYDQKLSKLTPGIVIIGMGDDAHITSLFPPLVPEAFGSANAIHTTTDRFAVHDRISTTLPFLHSAERRLFLITGEKKAQVLQKMQDMNEDASLYPAQYLFDERSVWFVGP